MTLFFRFGWGVVVVGEVGGMGDGDRGEEEENVTFSLDGGKETTCDVDDAFRFLGKEEGDDFDDGEFGFDDGGFGGVGCERGRNVLRS
mmetsp:Transcript_64593/g.95563  ORF Transcript_64593/g.95563 Transcript_64593/m.95563 type:complete len:88 (-) Transcript_64593:86-349(-)